MAGLAGTLAGTQQGIISFTQNNEQEADRIGIQVLQRAGFDPQAMPTFLQKLADQSRFASKPPEILLTHPLPDSRLADARNRAEQMRPVVVQSSQDYYMAKARALGMYATGQNQLGEDLLVEWSKGNARQQQAAQYGRALLFWKRKVSPTQKIIEPLLAKAPNNVWFLDIMTDIDIGLNQPQQAVARLSALKASSSDPVLQLNGERPAGSEAARRRQPRIKPLYGRILTTSTVGTCWRRRRRRKICAMRSCRRVPKGWRLPVSWIRRLPRSAAPARRLSWAVCNRRAMTRASTSCVSYSCASDSIRKDVNQRKSE